MVAEERTYDVACSAEREQSCVLELSPLMQAGQYSLALTLHELGAPRFVPKCPRTAIWPPATSEHRYSLASGLGPRCEPSPHGCQRELAMALWCLPEAGERRRV